jgi:hypothetical protein
MDKGQTGWKKKKITPLQMQATHLMDKNQTWLHLEHGVGANWIRNLEDLS